MSDQVREVPLGEVHRRLGARMVAFGGYQMPMQYGSIRAEHLAVRQQAGLFDVSHMGEVTVRGPGALDYLQRLVTNDVAKLSPGRALYSVMCRDDGGIVDDLLVYQDEDGYMCVINAACHDHDLAWMRAQLPLQGVEFEDVSEETCLLAVQGPRALEILAPLTEGTGLEEIRYYHHRQGRVAGVPVRISRTGYTGEDGFELYGPADEAERLWEAIYHQGAPLGMLPAGLGARDTLRLEAGLRLYGQDIDERTDPLSAGLGWVVKLGKGDFRGRESLQTIAADPPRQFIGLRLDARQIARPQQQLFSGAEPVGVVTSGSFSFTLGIGIAMGYVRSGTAPDAAELKVLLREDLGQWANATVVPLPFYRRPGG
ncbi:MAG: glycine cleavage system aminomethyltransferase GcvT [Candidatus Dormibacteria bacterium]